MKQRQQQEAGSSGSPREAGVWTALSAGAHTEAHPPEPGSPPPPPQQVGLFTVTVRGRIDDPTSPNKALSSRPNKEIITN